MLCCQGKLSHVSSLDSQLFGRYICAGYCFAGCWIVPDFSLMDWCQGKIITRYQIMTCSRARNNGRSTDNVRPECGVIRSNSYLAGHFDQSLLVKEQTNLHLN